MVGRAGRSDAAFCAVVRPSLPYRCRNVSCGVLKDRIMVNGGAKKRTESASRVIWVSPQSIYKAFLDSGSNRIVATIGGNEMPNPRVRPLTSRGFVYPRQDGGKSLLDLATQLRMSEHVEFVLADRGEGTCSHVRRVEPRP